MDVSNLIASALLSSGLVHPYGHVQQGADNGTPTTIDFRNMVENREGVSKSAADETDWHGAGFAAQDRLKNALRTPEADLVTGLSKLLYPATQRMFAPTGIQGGDIGGMKRASGNNHVGELVALSALIDLVNSTKPNRNGSLNFTTLDRGTPGVVWEQKW